MVVTRTPCPLDCVRGKRREDTVKAAEVNTLTGGKDRKFVQVPLSDVTNTLTEGKERGYV